MAKTNNLMQMYSAPIAIFQERIELSQLPTERRSLEDMSWPNDFTPDEVALLERTLSATFTDKSTSSMLKLDTLKYVRQTVCVELRNLPSKQIVTWLTPEEIKRRDTLCDVFKNFDEVYGKVKADEITEDASPCDITQIAKRLIKQFQDLIKSLRPNQSGCPNPNKVLEHMLNTAKLIESLLDDPHSRKLLAEHHLEEPLERLQWLLRRAIKETITYNYIVNQASHGGSFYPELEFSELVDTLEQLLNLLQELIPDDSDDVDNSLQPDDEERNSVIDIIDVLAQYVKPTVHKQTVHEPPTIEIDLDKIEQHAKAAGIARKHLLAIVFAHEMMHALLDRLPYYGMDCYIPEIDEAFAEFGMLQVVSQLGDPQLLKDALKHVYEKRRHPETRYYSLGFELFLLSKKNPRLFAYYYTLSNTGAFHSRKKFLETFVEAFRVSFPADRQTAFVALTNLLRLLQHDITPDIISHINQCLDLSY